MCLRIPDLKVKNNGLIYTIVYTPQNILKRPRGLGPASCRVFPPFAQVSNGLLVEAVIPNILLKYSFGVVIEVGLGFRPQSLCVGLEESLPFLDQYSF